MKHKLLYYNNSCSRDVDVVSFFHRVTASPQLIFLLLCLTLGLSFASLHHEADTSEDFHTAHQCSVFDSIHHAVIYATVSIPTTVDPEHDKNFESVEARLSANFRPRTRSPPLS
ncbi:hypothetical protein BCT23_18790 [Enterovibrio norvegicus]|uniref:Uncharacterized protein n=1 Tax=Enterovibrio norvegicus TaxID=188144 RepID=A0A2N7L8Y4_9GAMM|nr:hypothetical protein BCT23_18790 [Enterovibrio norvegicus]